MRTQPYYDREKLKQYVRSTGKSDIELAKMLGVRRMQIYRAINARGASLALVQRIVQLCNDILEVRARQHGIPFQRMDWRTLLSSEPLHTEKILQSSVS
jgi:hypothetical protein